mmetsp:Transcript_13523/g.26968  ORF Transcript_13523/g.26968 Transcript_13523/m.26968 type:complete len:279 (+) Transcript_13523:711-1547(+)
MTQISSCMMMMMIMIPMPVENEASMYYIQTHRILSKNQYFFARIYPSIYLSIDCDELFALLFTLCHFPCSRRAYYLSHNRLLSILFFSLLRSLLLLSGLASCLLPLLQRCLFSISQILQCCLVCHLLLPTRRQFFTRTTPQCTHLLPWSLPCSPRTFPNTDSILFHICFCSLCHRLHTILHHSHSSLAIHFLFNLFTIFLQLSFTPHSPLLRHANFIPSWPIRHMSKIIQCLRSPLRWHLGVGRLFHWHARRPFLSAVSSLFVSEWSLSLQHIAYFAE